MVSDAKTRIETMLNVQGVQCVKEALASFDMNNPVEVLFAYIAVDFPYMELPTNIYQNLQVLCELRSRVNLDDIGEECLFHFADAEYIKDVNSYRPASPILSITCDDSKFPCHLSNPVKFVVEFNQSNPTIIDVSTEVQHWVKILDIELPGWLESRLTKEREMILTSDYHLFPAER